MKEHVPSGREHAETAEEEARRQAPEPLGILELQRQAGNAAVGSLLQRQEASGGVQNRPNLLGGSGPQLHLDPQIEAEIRRIELQAQLDELLNPRRLQLSLRDISFLPPERPAWLPPNTGVRPPEPRPVVPPGEGPTTPHEASAGDLMQAIMAVPAVDGALTELKTKAGDRVQRDWGRLSTGERVLVVTAGVTIAGTALGGAMSNEQSRNFVLQQISGRDVPVPGIDGLSVQVNTQRENMGVTFTFDVGKHLPASWGFQ